MKSLFWLCRRGMKELDLLFLDYLENDYPQAAAAQQSAFQRLLQAQDPIILDWLFERQEVEDAEMQKLVLYLRQKAINKAS